MPADNMATIAAQTTTMHHVVPEPDNCSNRDTSETTSEAGSSAASVDETSKHEAVSSDDEVESNHDQANFEEQPTLDEPCSSKQTQPGPSSPPNVTNGEPWQQQQPYPPQIPFNPYAIPPAQLYQVIPPGDHPIIPQPPPSQYGLTHPNFNTNYVPSNQTTFYNQGAPYVYPQPPPLIDQLFEHGVMPPDWGCIETPGPASLDPSVIQKCDQELFVHIQEGISICLEANKEPIFGPCTIKYRANGEAPCIPMPMFVPQGFLIQQIIDNNSFLKHILFGFDIQGDPRLHERHHHYNQTDFEEPTHSRHPQPYERVNGRPHNTRLIQNNFNKKNCFLPLQNNYNLPPPLLSNVKDGRGKAYTTKPLPNYIPNNNNGKNNGNGRLPKSSHSIHSLLTHAQIKENLTMKEMPMLVKATCREAEIAWKGVKLNKISQQNGYVSAFDEMAIGYVVELKREADAEARHYNMPEGVCSLKMLGLHPASMYGVFVTAFIKDRKIYGKKCPSLQFKTQSTVPASPALPTFSVKGSNWFQIHWNYPEGNGHPISSFIVQVARNKVDPFTKIWEGLSETCKISDLDPGLSYRVRVVACNVEGYSEPSGTLVLPMTVTPRTTLIVQPPATPAVMQLHHDKVVLCYEESYKYGNEKNIPTYRIEMLECEYFENGPKENVSFIPQHKMRNGTVEVEIENTKMYKFRLVVDNASGEPHKSDWIEVKPPASGTKFAYDPSASCRFMSAVSKNVMYVPAPTTLRKQSETSEGNVMISWNYIGKDEATFLLEGSCSSECTDWKVIFSGKTTKYLICDKSLVTFRVKALVKDKLSAYSEVLFVQRCTFNGKKSMSCLKIEKSARPHFNEKRKPDVCSLPKIKNITSNSVVIRWQIKNLLDETNDVASPTFSQLSSPQISNSLFYELQRVDSSPLIIYSGDASEFKYEDLKPLEHIQIRARAVTIDNDGNRSEGDWSSIASCCTLSPLPLPPQNLRLQNVSSLRLRNSKLIIWNEPADGSVILEYKIYSYHHEADDNNFKGTLIEISSTPDTNYLLENIVGNNKYVFSVTAVTKAGESEKCDAVCFVSDTLLPSMPTNFDKCEVGTKNITMVWGSPASNGDSVTNYCLDVIEKTGRIEYKEGVPIEDNQLVASIILDHKTFKANIGELKPLTEYIVKLHATSREGKGGEIEKIVKTLQEPPSPPSLTLLGTTFCGLRIKINSVEEVHYYCVEQEREEGGFMKVYSGEGSSIKIKHLKEHTYYNFRVCSAFNCGQACSEYSEIYSFQTGRTAPAAIKKVPLIHEHSPTNYTIEWPAVVASPGLYKDDIVGELKYRVEMTSKFGNEKPLEGWKTIYEDTHNSFNYLLEPGFQIAGKQVRVITIRNIDGNQYYSLPSTVAYFKNCVHQPLESPKKLAGENNGTVEGVVSKISKAKADEQAKFIKNLIKGKKNNGSISFYFKKGCAYFSFPFVITVIICALIAFLFTMVGRFLY